MDSNHVQASDEEANNHHDPSDDHPNQGQENNNNQEGENHDNHDNHGEENGEENGEKKKEIMESSPKGLTTEEAQRLLAENGPNELAQSKNNAILQFLRFFNNPLSWAMEVAAIVSIILLDYVDFGLILALLVFNACLGFWEERSAGNALEALRSQLALNAKVIRDGALKTIPARELVVGDRILLKLGDIVPADAQVLTDECKVDQAALTGESLPVVRYVGDIIYSGSTLKEGEINCVITATGSNTFFGKAAKLVENTNNEGHLQKVMTIIGTFCIFYITIFVVLEIIIQFAARGRPCTGVDKCTTLENCLVLIVGGIPVAMPTVLSVTMAIGASQLVKKNAIVSRLTAIEELAGMDILCSDKTGTLTLNQLTIDEPLTLNGITKDQILFDALLCSRLENPDAIDTAVASCAEEYMDRYHQHEVMNFLPFDPVKKRTQAQIRDPDGNVFFVTKGAPQQILNLLKTNKKHIDLLNQEENTPDVAQVVHQAIEDYADRGYRVIGIARANCANTDGNEQWIFEGLLPIYDPPREDTADTVEKVKGYQIKVKMITGDHLSIAKETGRRLGIGTNMHTAKVLENEHNEPAPLSVIEDADGFAEVFPEHKYEIVRRLQNGGHIVGMTGDGVNDAPALKRADIGIAVAGATDAARAAADIILLAPGLGVIVDAILGSRKIFQRMKNYASYSLIMCVRIVTTFGLLTLIYGFEFPTLLIVILAILNDGTIITISKDRVKPSPKPEEWKLSLLFIRSIVIGLYLMMSTIVLFTLAHDSVFWTYFGLDQLSDNELRGMVYLQVSISGAAVIFVTRSRTLSYIERPGVLLAIAFIVSQTVATIIGIFGFNGYPGNGTADFEGCGWAYAILIWIWFILWYIPLDFIKMGIGFVYDRVAPRFERKKEVIEDDTPKIAGTEMKQIENGKNDNLKKSQKSKDKEAEKEAEP
eukprot:TRINITY_DN197_c0_g2_i1.p1 TRINITY_DN197_c0_g2~~TRINITY_DN197_c0_g2_i1.p1  ORF type:complete len:936 (-),score=226.49 TRINITY_DN197_c0_g2_i1:96-2903(-)